MPERTNKTKKKTSVQKSVKNVKWDSLLQFTDVMLEELKDRALELSIYHHRKLKTNEFLGGVRLNLGLGKFYLFIIHLAVIWGCHIYSDRRSKPEEDKKTF